MPNIGPKQTTRSLRKLTKTKKTADGGRSFPALPGVTADPPKGSACDLQNRALGRVIENAVRAIKTDRTKSDVPRFVVAWRMYPNAAHPDWQAQQAKGGHVCACSCGCGTNGDPDVTAPPKTRSRA